MRGTEPGALATLVDLAEVRKENEARRQRTRRKHRIFKLVEVIACILGLLWTALLLGSLLRHRGA